MIFSVVYDSAKSLIFGERVEEDRGGDKIGYLTSFSATIS